MRARPATASGMEYLPVFAVFMEVPADKGEGSMGIPYWVAIDLIFSRWMIGTPRSPMRKMIPRARLRTAGTFFRRPAESR